MLPSEMRNSVALPRFLPGADLFKASTLQGGQGSSVTCFVCPAGRAASAFC